MDRSKSIDELYDEITEKGYDVVITNDSPLCTALNARCRPGKLSFRLGKLCYRPRDIALEIMRNGKIPVCDDISAMGKLKKYGSMRYVYGEMSRIRQKLREDASYESGGIFRDFRKIDGMIENFMLDRHDKFLEWLGGRKAVVINPELFDALDEKFVGKLEELETFAGNVDLDPFVKIGNGREMAEAAAELVVKGREDRFAIVLNKETSLKDEVKSALKRKDVSFKDEKKTGDFEEVRNFVKFVSLSAQYDFLRVDDVRYLFSYFGCRFEDKSNVYLKSVKKDCRRNLRSLMKNASNMTFSEVKNRLFDEGKCGTLDLLLFKTGFSEKKVTEENVSDLEFVASEIDVGNCGENEDAAGVLIADCKTAGYIDRPVVIFLGLDDDWDTDVTDSKYPEKALEAESLRMKILLNQGVSRFYLLGTSKYGKKPEPAAVLERIGLAEHFKKAERRNWEFAGSGEKLCREDCLKKAGEEYFEKHKKEKFSEFYPTDFNKYYGCSLSFVFQSVALFEENETNAFGNAIHKFAKDYVGERIRGNENLELWVENEKKKILEKISPFSEFSMEGLNEAKVGYAVDSVVDFIDGKFNPDLQTEKKLRKDNLAGKIDLIDCHMVYDYKTGKFRDNSDIVKNCDTESDSVEHFDFQPLFYLYLASENGDGEFQYIYPLEKDDKRSSPTIKIVDSLEDYFFNELERTYGGKINRVKFFNKVEISDAGNVTKELNEELFTFFGVADKDVTRYCNMCDNILKGKKYLKNGNQLILENSLMMSLKEETSKIDEFEKFVVQGGEAKPRVKCDDCYYRCYCTKANASDGGESDE